MLSQILAITAMNLRNIGSRWDSSSVIVVGIGGVVGVLVGILSIATGFSAALESTALDDRALVLRAGSSGEMNSNMGIGELNLVTRLDGIRLATGELYVVADVPKRDTGTDANLVVRGVQQDAFDVRPEVRVVEGRRFEPGRNELIVGSGAAREFANMEVGGQIDIRNAEWTVVGVFDADGSAYESEIWTDLPMAQTTFRRAGTVNSVRVRVDDPARMQELAKRIEDDPRLDLQLVSEAEFYSAQSEGLSGIITGFGYAVAVIMAIGAVFAALNTMYTAVSLRTVEIATLRALGFGSVPVVISVMIEALALALVGGVLGAAIVYFVMDGNSASTLNNASFSQVAFEWQVTPELLSLGVTWAIVLGLIGGLFPAVRAARLPITTALRGE